MQCKLSFQPKDYMTTDSYSFSMSVPELGHELNNILTMVKAHVFLLEESLHEKDEAETFYRLTQAKLGIERIEEFTKKLSLSSKPGTTECDSAYLLRRVISFVKVHELFRSIDISIENTAKATFIMADEMEIQHVFLNLLKNSAEAMEKGNIRIQFSNPDDSRLQIRIIDNGPGICDEVINEIFDVHPSLKGPGHGYGLHITHKLVVKNHGRISCQSSVGSGTSFIVEFPVITSNINPA